MSMRKREDLEDLKTAKLTNKLIVALTKHAYACKNCNHTIQDVLGRILVEKVQEYMIGEDLVAAQDR